MAILENRVKLYSKSHKHKGARVKLFSIISLINFLSILAVLIFLFNSSFLSLNSHLVEINGFTYSNLINPSKEFVKNSIKFVVNITNFHNLHNENLYLKLQNNKLVNEISYGEQIKIENTQLLKTLNAVKPENYGNLRAKLIFQSGSDSGFFAVIAAGKKHGIKANQIILSNGYLVGRIVTVGENYSKLSLVNSYNSRIPVKTKDTGIKAILVGAADKGGYLLHINSGQKPKNGELIFTSGDGSFYPKDIPVASVYEINGENIRVTLVNDLSTTDFVEVIDHNNLDN